MGQGGPGLEFRRAHDRLSDAGEVVLRRRVLDVDAHRLRRGHGEQPATPAVAEIEAQRAVLELRLAAAGLDQPERTWLAAEIRPKDAAQARMRRDIAALVERSSQALQARPLAGAEKHCRTRGVIVQPEPPHMQRVGRGQGRRPGKPAHGGPGFV
jgi:hypothetical protein